ncbi:MAG TPA: LCP family protein, partial [Chloroflexota bacterium]|nr:LCP family protein [Chloroflexota bacterium]
MATETAPPPSELFPLPSLPRPRRSRRRSWFFITGTFFLTLILACLLLIASPPVLEGLSAAVLPPQPGAIPWNGRDRITVVAEGLTQRTTEPARTDTLLVMDIDPADHRINMLSVPRDLWVNIPGYGYGKLAIAYEIGGPKLAAYTLESTLGIPVDYSMALTFRGFIKIVNAMGGVTVNVPRELKDPTYPCLVGTAYCPIDIKAGVQHMNGYRALEFVRERHAFAQQDLARVQDQQAFSTAVKHQLLSPSTWPRIPSVISAVRDSLMTNLPLNALPEIGAQMALPISSVNHDYINMSNGLVKPSWSADGQSILVPTSSTAIPNLVHRLFGDPEIAQQHASVDVLNGTTTVGLASDVGGTLSGLGFNVTSEGNADRFTYQQGEVIVNTS